MGAFFATAPMWLFIEYVASAGTLLAYLTWKFRSRRYLFSPFTLVLLTFAFTLYIAGPYAYNDEAWRALNMPDAGAFASVLDRSLAVNLAGFLIVVMTMWIVEARFNNSAAPPLVMRPPRLSLRSYRRLWVLGVAVFAACIITVGAIPLFGGRTVFYEHEGLRPVYNFANFLILVTTSVLVVWSWAHRSRQHWPLIAIGLACMLFTGGRTSFLSVIELMIMLAVYRRYANRSGAATVVMCAALAGVALLGLFLASFRAGDEFALGRVSEAVVYGNTFSDIRDGAFVLFGWESHGGESLFGRTYLAGVFSFVPSSLSEFRQTWSWGHYTTEGLFGFQNHYGFRGGWSLEAYLNFGWAGVIVLATACGWLLGRLEANFYGGVIRRTADYPAVYAAGWLGFAVFTVLIASSATYNLYVLLLVLAGNRVWRKNSPSNVDRQRDSVSAASADRAASTVRES